MIKENTNASSIVSKVWAFCQTLRDDGVEFDVEARIYNKRRIETEYI